MPTKKYSRTHWPIVIVFLVFLQTGIFGCVQTYPSSFGAKHTPAYQDYSYSVSSPDQVRKAYVLAMRRNTHELYETFLKNHPDARYVPDVRKRLAKLGPKVQQDKIVDKKEKSLISMQRVQPLPVIKHPTSNTDTLDNKKIAVGQTVPSVEFGRYHALVIGNNAYSNLPVLKTAVHDAQVVANTLKRLYGYDVTLLLNGTRRTILKTLDTYRKQLTDGDNLLIFYAGHGYYDKKADRGYWLPVEAEQDTTVDWISNADITDKLKTIEAKHIMIVADSCYSGTLTRGINIMIKDPGYLKRIVKKRARTVLTSGGNEPVMDGGVEGHSVFAKIFIQTLNDNPDIMDGTTLFTKIRRPVMLNAPQTPQYSDLRFAGHDGGDFIFVRKQ